MKEVTDDEVTAALAALRQFQVLDGRAVSAHARAALEAGLKTRMDAVRKSVEAFHAEVEDSCGCIFCDMDLEPVEHDGRQQHHVRVSKRLRKTAPPLTWVPCTRPQ